MGDPLLGVPVMFDEPVAWPLLAKETFWKTAKERESNPQGYRSTVFETATIANWFALPFSRFKLSLSNALAVLRASATKAEGPSEFEPSMLSMLGSRKATHYMHGTQIWLSTDLRLAETQNLKPSRTRGTRTLTLLGKNQGCCQ